MAYYYSASERAFFSSELMSTDAMPSDKVAVADQTYKQLMADQVAGKLIRTGSGNAPESVDQGLTAATRFGDVSFGKVTGTNLDINGNGDVSGTFQVGSAVTIKGALNAQGGLNVTSITATGTSTLAAVNATNILASGTLKVNGATTLQAVSAKKVTATELDLNGNGDVSGNLVVHGKTTLEALQANGDVNVGGLLKVTGKATVDDIAIHGSSTDFAGDRGQIGNCDAVTDIDFNEYGTKSGVWRISGTYQNGGDFGDVAGFLVVYANKQLNYAVQFFIRTLSADTFYIRTKHGEWQPWRRLILDQNINAVGLVSFLQAQNLTAEQKTQALQNVGALPLTGGDLTGDVTNTGTFTVKGSTAYKQQYANLDRDVPPQTDPIQNFPLTLVDKNGKTAALIKYWQQTTNKTCLQIGTARSTESGGTNYATFEVGFDDNGTKYMNVPDTPSNANGVQAATAKFVNDRIKNSTDVVHTTGSETINGSKTFGSPVVSNANTLIQSANWSGIRLGDTSRASDSIKMIAQVLDADAQRWIGLETTASALGHRTVQLIGRNRTNTGWLNFIKFWDYADGSFAANLAANTPSTAINTEVATAKFVNDQIQSIDDKIVRPIAWRETGSAPGGPVVVTINNLVVGQTLYLLLDTNNGLSDISRTATYDFTGLTNNEQIGIFNPQNRSFNMFARTVAEETVTITMNLNGCSDMSIVVFGVTNA